MKKAFQCLVVMMVCCSLLFFMGCASLVNLSSRAPYNQTVGRQLPLQREVVICRITDKAKHMNTIIDVFSKEKNLHLLFGKDASNFLVDYYKENVCDGELTVVQIGTDVQVDKVLGHGSIGGGNIVVLGKVFVADIEKWVSFQYMWGGSLSYSFKIPRAPWEDDSVPFERDVGRLGTGAAAFR